MHGEVMSVNRRPAESAVVFPDMAAPSRGLVCPSFAGTIPPSKHRREQGMPGARCTRGLACKIVRKNAHEHTGSAEAVRPSLRTGFTAYFALSPVTGLS